ncbi:prorelaxin H2-like [Elephas maximus indicus]|uniref:prorelaxin H2-like n=1 Tax=Elephas maximus indicus TaxID=99487 RepID=UPI0021169A5B|nr:prorelaxin H2-like [Elephas maximus indicus]
MPHPVFFHLLGVWLLLSHSPREAKAQGSNIVKLCGRELARARIEICGQINWGKNPNRGKSSLISALVADTVSSSINRGMETLDRMSKFIPHFQVKVMPNVELVKIIKKRQSEAEDSSPSELKDLVLDKHSRKKRTGILELSNKCCYQGCTVRELARGC